MIFRFNKKKYKGIWFFGLSGSGKTYFSKKIKSKIKNHVLVDGDNVRKLISSDLNYSKAHRKIQISRVLGIARLIIESNKFPIISTVYMDKNINYLCKKNKIMCVMILRKDFGKMKKNFVIYKKKNVVGKDIFYENFKKIELINDNSPLIFKC